MSKEREPRVNFTLRLPWALHKRVQAEAKRTGVTVNDWLQDAMASRLKLEEAESPPTPRAADRDCRNNTPLEPDNG